MTSETAGAPEYETRDAVQAQHGLALILGNRRVLRGQLAELRLRLVLNAPSVGGLRLRTLSASS